jgi:hypothetical protein
VIWVAIVFAAVIGFLLYRRDIFWQLLDVYHELKPCRFSVIVALLGAFVFLKNDQGTEVLRALAERGELTGATNLLRLTSFAIALLAWSLASWYSARVLLDFDFQTTRVPRVDLTPKWRRFHRFLRRNVPRLLGALPLFVVGLSLLRARASYEDNPPRMLTILGWLALAGGAILWLLFKLRRRFLQSPADAKKYSGLKQMHRLSRSVLVTMSILSVALALLFIFNPIRFAGNLGTGAVLGFAAACWVFWGSVLVYLGALYRLPALTLIVAWIAICSLTNDNHDIRTISRADPFQRPQLIDALRVWHDDIVKKYPARPVHPLFIVATEGGGIRAAYWTAAVLGSLQDTEASFSDHVFAISGVSGGSVGASVFAALLADGTQSDFAKRAEETLGHDFLSPAIAAMLYPDFLQRLWPWPCTFLDRGHWLEESWEQSWKTAVGNERFGAPFFDLWKTNRAYVPALFLNGTSVESGNRIIISNIVVDEKNFFDAEDATRKLLPEPEQSDEAKRTNAIVDLPLSTAAHFSARFTYVSPAGRFASDGTHEVDGGYFENSGAATALDILRQVMDAINDPNNHFVDIAPKIVMISNDPLSAAFAPQTETESPATQVEQAKSEPGTFLEDALAPVYALLNSREARGTYAQRAIVRALENFYQTAHVDLSAVGPTKVYVFRLAPAKVPLPLGWMLSNRAANAMQQQLCDEGKSDETEIETWNKQMREEIIFTLVGHGSPSDPCAPASHPTTASAP